MQKNMNQLNQAKTIPAHLSRDEITRLIKEKVQELRTYTPKVGVFGVTGVGKSSLCNALFGKEVSPVSDVAACTREPQEIFIGSDNQGIKLIDVPGVGETIERDAEYFELYKQLAPELDLIIWVIKADDRAFAIAEKAYKEIFETEKCSEYNFKYTNPKRERVPFISDCIKCHQKPCRKQQSCSFTA